MEKVCGELGVELEDLAEVLDLNLVKVTVGHGTNGESRLSHLTDQTDRTINICDDVT